MKSEKRMHRMETVGELVVLAGMSLMILTTSGQCAKDGRAGADGLVALGPTTCIDDPFWNSRLRLWRSVTANYTLDKFEPWICNFDKAAKGGRGKIAGPPFADGLIYEMLRGLADHLRAAPDAALQKRVEAVVERIAAVSDISPDGYLKTETMLEAPHHRWGDNGGDYIMQHELWNVGCLVEAAVHLYRATGNLRLLYAATRAANLFVQTIGPAPRRNLVPAHELPEEAFFKLWELYEQNPELAKRVGVEACPGAYRDLAIFWLEHRGVFGNDPKRHKCGIYAQDHLPVAQQDTIEGHAVRAALFGTGLATAVRAGRPDFLPFADRLWNNMIGRKMYVSGGVGTFKKEEKFGVDWALPSEGYLETCAAVASAFWSLHMARIHNDGLYVDEVDRVLYNALLTAVGQDGKKFTYVNPLNSRKHSRWDWHYCPCCPPMFLKLTGILPEILWHQQDGTLFADLFVGGRTVFALPGGNQVSVKTTTEYPWGDTVTFEVENDASFTLAVRIPGWARGKENPWDLYASETKGNWQLSVNGAACHADVAQGYVRLTRAWRAGDKVLLKLPMAARAVVAHPNVKELSGRVSFARGPVVYSFEKADNPDLDGLRVPRTTAFEPEWCGGLAGGVMLLKAGGVKAVPYFAIANRGAETAFDTWVQEAASRPAAPQPTVKNDSGKQGQKQ